MDKLKSQLNDYQRKWPEEIASVTHFLNFVTTYPNCFDRDLKVGHVTGSAWVVNEENTHVLLTHHKKLNRWLQLGGHADGNPNILEVALREVEEESGLKSVQVVNPEIFDIDIHLIPARAETPEHYHYDIRFAFKAVGEEEYVVSDESHDLAWIEIKKIENISTDESMLRMARKWIHG